MEMINLGLDMYLYAVIRFEKLLGVAGGMNNEPKSGDGEK